MRRCIALSGYYDGLVRQRMEERGVTYSAALRSLLDGQALSWERRIAVRNAVSAIRRAFGGAAAGPTGEILEAVGICSPAGIGGAVRSVVMGEAGRALDVPQRSNHDE